MTWADAGQAALLGHEPAGYALRQLGQSLTKVTAALAHWGRDTRAGRSVLAPAPASITPVAAAAEAAAAAAPSASVLPAR